MAGSGLFSNQYAKKPHLLQQTGGIAAEVKDLRDDIQRVLGPLAAMAVEEFVTPPAAVTDAVLASVASQAAAAVYEAADLVGGAAVVLDPPRNVTLTCDAGGGATWTGNLKVKGLDANGAAIEEDIAFTASATTPGLLAFAKVTGLEADAQADALGNWEVGFGDVIGLAKPLISRAGAGAVMMEIEDGTVLAADAITGTFVDAATAAPNGTYEPATAPTGLISYAIYYEYDPTA
jgi:hypothetical protein